MATKLPVLRTVGDLGTEKRARASPKEWALVTKRSVPAFYIINDQFRVLNFHVDLSYQEKRADCRFDANSRALPELIAKTVRNLADRREQEHCNEQTLVALPNSSLFVRAVWLAGDFGNNIAVFVEQFKSRNYVRQATARYALSKREEEVLGFLVRGARTSEIATSLFIAPTTVIYHMNSLMEKTHSHSRTEIVAKALA
ncbi:MAG: helix-turn-helix transcriptional regulator [Candidatus Eremiobacteraeota bacterium]|nr:helix-turn-helix transcriptional regulator [Candidatus Eremiobacteraeota bacterium]